MTASGRPTGATAARDTADKASPLRWIVPLAILLVVLFVAALLLLNNDDDDDGDIDGEAIAPVVLVVDGPAAA